MARQRGCGIVTGGLPTETQPKVYRRHNCERRHRTYGTLAKCIWPRPYGLR